MKIKSIIPAVAAALILQAGAAFAQEPGAERPRGERDGERGGDREGRRGNPEEFRQRMNDRLKSSLKASDEEWAVIQPLLEKVTTKQRESGGSRWGGRDRGGDNDRPQSAAATASQALRTAVESDSASPDEIKAKLTAMREARKSSQAELAKVREELRQVLSVRQEAALVSMGILE